MTVRPANFSDIPGIVALLQDAHRRSHYGLDGRVSVDVKETKRVLVQSVQRHGGRNGGATWVSVATSGEEITGLILGTLARVYVIGDKLMATDLFFVCSERVDPTDPYKLARGFVEWAKSCPLVVELKCGTTAVIQDDPMKAGAIWERLGMKHYGEIWRLPCQE